MNIVKHTREIMNLSQTELADLIGMTRRQILNLEQGKSKTTKPIGLLLICLQKIGCKELQELEKKLASYYIDADIF